MASGQSSELPNLVNLIKTLTLPQLKDLLRNEGLPVSGLKAAVQVRIIDCQFVPLPPPLFYLLPPPKRRSQSLFLSLFLPLSAYLIRLCVCVCV